MIECTREAVLSYLSDVKQEFREDETNNDLAFRRNLIRQEWLPKLEAAFPDARGALRRLAEQCRETQAIVDTLAEELLALCDLRLSEDGGFSLLAGPLADAQGPLARDTLRLAWRTADLGEQGMTRRWWCDLTEMAREGGDGVLILPGGVRASVEAERLVLRGGSG